MYFRKMVGKLCYLSPIDINDAEKFTEWLNDLEVTQNLSLYNLSVNVETERELLVKLSKDHHYSIVDNETNQLIGVCGFFDHDLLHQKTELGIFIGDKNYWGKGYGTEALRLLLDFGFKALNINNVILKVFSFNERAIETYKKVGFKIIGARREAVRRGANVYDTIYMDILPRDFYCESQLHQVT